MRNTLNHRVKICKDRLLGTVLLARKFSLDYSKINLCIAHHLLIGFFSRQRTPRGGIMKSVGSKFFVSIGAVFIVFSAFLLFRTYSTAHHYIDELIGREADMALRFNLAIRKYVSDQIRPIMYSLVGPDEFIPETMSSSFVARSVFAEVKKDSGDIVLKFSSDNPRNPENQAGPEELRIIEYFNDNPDKEFWAGEIRMNGQAYEARFRARRMKEECLRCHGNPEDAPLSMIARYGDKAAFHRPLNKVIALDTVAVPLDAFRKRLWLELGQNLLFFGVSLIVLLFTIVFVFRFFVSSRLRVITGHFASLAEREEYSEITPLPVTGGDEISLLVKNFNDLAAKLKNYSISQKNQLDEQQKTNLKLLQEIEERKKIEKKLQRWEHIFQNAQWGVAIGGVENQVLELMNPAFARMHGYTVEELTGTPVVDIYAPEVRDKVKEQIRIVHEQGHYTFESRHIRKDGTVFPVLLDITAVRDEQGNVLYRVANTQDITVRKRLEEQLLQAQKMEAIGKLAGGISHDFNNLLTTILGYSEIIAMKMAEDDPLLKHVQAINSAGMKAASLTGQLLAFSRKQLLEMKVVVLDDVVLDMVKMFSRFIGEDISLELLFSAGKSRIYIDPGQLQQVLMNIVINARDAMPDGGRLTIETGTVYFDKEYTESVEITEPGPYVFLCVTDTGHGMSREVRERIFEPFFTTKEKGKGTGLGLSTVYGIVKQQKGHISIYSEPDIGTAIKVYFPEVEDEITHQHDVPLTEMPRGSELILVVEDEESICKLIVDTLTPLGYRVITATNGIDALKVAESTSEKIDLLLTDVIMPKMNGRDLADKVAALRPETKIVFMSGYTENVIAHHGVLDQGIQLINKPLSPSSLARTLRSILDG